MKNIEQILHDRAAQTRQDARIAHDDGPLPEEAWQVVLPELERAFDEIITARGAFQPIMDTTLEGMGITELKQYSLSDQAGAVASFDGEPEVGDRPTIDDDVVHRIVMQKDTPVPFQIRESLTRTQIVALQDFAQENAEKVGTLENDIAYTGHDDLGFNGFLSPTGVTSSAGSEWNGNPGNVKSDVKSMKHDLRDQNIDPDSVAKILFVSSKEKEEGLEQEDSNGDEVGPKLLGNGHIDGVVTTDKQTDGEATLFPMTPRVARWHLVIDGASESYRTGNSQRADTVLGTWSASIFRVKKAAAVIKRTGI